MPWVETKTLVLWGGFPEDYLQSGTKEETLNCVICSKDQSLRVCPRCRQSMSRQLRDLRFYRVDAALNLQPVKSGERGSERGLGVRLDALDFVAGFDILPVLEEWERDWRRVFELAPYGEASRQRLSAAVAAKQGFLDVAAVELDECLRFLERWLDKACDDYEPIDEFAIELRSLWRKGQAAAGQQPRTSWRVTCPADTDDGECGYPLRISGEDFDREIQCRRCGSGWTVKRLLMVVATSSQAELWLDPEAASIWYQIPTRELRRWGAAGIIKRKHGRYESHSIRDAIQNGGRSREVV